MKLINFLIITFSVLLLASCKLSNVTYSRNGASIPEDAKTFSVNYIENRAAYVEPTLSNQLTEALKEKFNNETNLSEVLGGNGDLHFEGEIKRDYLKPTSITSDDYAAATRLTIEVRIKYTNKKDDKYDFDSTFSAYQDMDETQDRSEVASDLIEEIIEQIVDDIYNKAVVNW